MKTWNIGVVGAGLIADFHAHAVNDIDNAKLIGFCDSGSGHAKELAGKYSCRAFANYQEMVDADDIDILAIATPHHLHAPACMAAAERGKHVICEKPMALDAKEARRMHDACRANEVTFGLISQNRFNPEKRWIKDRITSGQLDGLVRSDFVVDWFRGNDYYAEN
ncbi:MAG: Gfo/Idh/MocA family oxidoreductase, partial [Candidatus Latescibacteria bacterium]|nr:Gfo/Idh/MocA family oxidoreductase [Candidatus Latescibacterota bacterium]